ncbi:MAG: hypothetical protein IH963_15975, partial [Chloroflexi bacterium]|nr:hypothetical protein [Chloroflexota bacterium]
MRRFNSYEIYTLSEHLKALESIKVGTPVRDWVFSIFMARMSLQQLLNGEPVPIKVTREAARTLVAHLAAWTTEESLNNDEPNFDSYQIATLKSSLLIFNTVLNAEFANLDTFWVEPKGIYSTSDLIENAENIFGEATRIQLAEGSRIDINEAGKALAFDLPTAVGFHVWRAAEREFRAYYQKWSGKSAGNKTWGTLHNELAETNADPKALAVL